MDVSPVVCKRFYHLGCLWSSPSPPLSLSLYGTFPPQEETNVAHCLSVSHLCLVDVSVSFVVCMFLVDVSSVVSGAYVLCNVPV